ncbi:zinc finger protein 385D-like [Sitophilus oryzae]|uniref:Zinc finger protein 385D-like n=1 Tax=Sitophilus oryzae TaxID=7048 RepID=A0A6J2XID4_SITOR|nr:zinc finger protein 385D-like [Sitophilus oryzae]
MYNSTTFSMNNVSNLTSSYYTNKKTDIMSGDIHSGVQDVILSEQNELENQHDLTKSDNIEELLKTGKYSTISTIGNGNSASELSLCCDICNIRVTSAKILQRHLEGRRHKSRAERDGKTFHCELCDVTANSEIQLNIHMSSSRHKSRIAREEYKEFTSLSSYSTSFYILLFCIFCIGLNVVILVKGAF